MFESIFQSLGLCVNRRCRRLITPFIDGELDVENRQRVEEHLHKCAACLAEYDELLFASRIVSKLALPSTPPAGMSAWSKPQSAVISHRGRKTIRFYAPIGAGVLIVALVSVMFYLRRQQAPQQSPEQSSWEVMRLSGSPAINSNKIGKTSILNAGEWLETDSRSRALLRLGLVGQVEIDSNTRIGLVTSQSNEQRFSLVRGSIFVATNTPPRVFFIETPSGVAVDLGCAYTLQVDEAGVTQLRVTSGSVAMAFRDRESYAPTGTICLAKPLVGPGTPFFENASEPFRRELERLDFERGGSASLNRVLAEARASDAITLWNLLRRVEGDERSRVFDRLSNFVAAPEGTTRDGVLRLDDGMLNLWLRRIEQTRSGSVRPPLAPGSLKMIGNLEAARYAHRATLLPDGKVLVTGGINTAEDRMSLASAELFDPATGQFAPGPNMAGRRGLHTSTLLRTGKVLITGGAEGEIPNSEIANAELYDPATGRFTPTGSMSVARVGHDATMLSDGRVLITGGAGPGFDSPYLASAEIYDPQTGTFKSVGNMSRPRVNHKATLLTDGRVLITGGFTVLDERGRATSSAEIFDPLRGKFLPTGDMKADRFKHSAVLLMDGKVLIAGGIEIRPPNGLETTSSEIYDPATGLFTQSGRMNLPRFKLQDAAVLLKDGKVLIAGGSWGIEIYDPATKSFSLLAGEMILSRYYSTATMLASGDVIIIGGYGAVVPVGLPQSNANAWIYRPEQ